MSRYYTSDEIRAVLNQKMIGRTQAEVAREIGMKFQNLSVMLKGAPINGKLLKWLGFRRVETLYEKAKAVK